MNRKELINVLERHRKWLTVEAGRERANLHGADLRRANLRGANLRRADLSDANLSWANLSDANLSWANLSDANLSWANLHGADLHGANLSDANLRGANLRRANLSDANLSDANLSDANLSHANLIHANLSDADLRDADLRGANGNNEELQSLQTGRYLVIRSATVMAIGCEQHSIENWMAFDDKRITSMGDGALEWWRVWKPIIQQWIDASTPEEKRAAA